MPKIFLINLILLLFSSQSTNLISTAHTRTIQSICSHKVVDAKVLNQDTKRIQIFMSLLRRIIISPITSAYLGV